METELNQEEVAQLIEDSRRGLFASEVIEHPFYKEAFESIRLNICESIVNANSQELRSDASLQLKAIYTVQQYFDNAIKDAEFAQAELTQWERVKQKIKRVIKR